MSATTPDILSIDFETCSTADLRKTGAAAYAVDPSTQIICMAWAFNDEPVEVWTPGQPFPDRIRKHVHAHGLVRGWNISFEFWIWNEVLVPGFSVHRLMTAQLRDTMAQAAYWGLPMSLDKAGWALKLGTLKNKAGHALMLRMCRPRRIEPDGTPAWWHEEDAAKFAELCSYCEQDVRSERALANDMPPLPDNEQRVWELDFRINLRGVRLDKQLVHQLGRIAEEAKQSINLEMARITGGQVKKATAARNLLAWLQANSYSEDNIKRATLAHVYKLLPAGDVTTVVGLRLDAARASTAKLSAMLACTNPHSGRIHGLLQYYGAGRTGRWAGRLVQPQNFPRGSIKGVDSAIRLAMNGIPADDLAMFFEDSPLGVVASCLRGCLTAAPGNKLAVADLAQIEARVVAWLAGQHDILDVFARGEDVYVYTANKMGSNDRQMGKVIVLACGFGMGWQKFKATAETYGLFLTDEEAFDAVAGYRESNPNIVSFWWDCDRAARAIAAGSVKETVGLIEFTRRKNTMLIRLPSGRELVYRNIRMETDADNRLAIVYDGLDQRTKQYGPIRTYGGKIVENIVQAVARDIMAWALVTLDALGLSPILTIHDEILDEGPEDTADDRLDTILLVLKTPPRWAAGLPVGAAGWVGHRYKKG